MKTIQRPQSALTQAIGGPEIWLKREDQHPYGSHKGRSIPIMIKEYRKREGFHHFVISSSGNAALAAAITVSKHNQNNPGSSVRLQIFVGQNIPNTKLAHLKKYVDGSNVTIDQVERPKQTAFQLEKEQPETIKFLRQSTDDLALRGYLSLAEDLGKIPDLCAVFIPTSSGTTAQAIAENFVQMEKHIQVHVVQTEACHPIAEALGGKGGSSESSVAGAIVDNVAHRKEACANAVTQTGGKGWIVNDAEIKEAASLVKQQSNLDISPNAALSVAGLKKALAAGWMCEGPVVCLITGA